MSIKKKIISYIIGSTLIFSMFPIIANAETKTVEINEVKGKKYVSLTELTNAYEGTIVDNSDINVMIYNLNGKVITVNSKTAFISIDNNLIPLETKEVSGIIVPSLDAEKVTADNGEILIPVSIIETYFGIKCTDEGFNITITEVDEKEEESLPTDDTDSYENTSDYYTDYYEDYYTETEEVYIEKPTNENTSNNNNNSSNTNDSSSSENSDDTSNGSSSNDEQATSQPEEPPTPEQEPVSEETPASEQEVDSEETPTPEQEPDTEQTPTLKPEQEPNTEMPESS